MSAFDRPPPGKKAATRKLDSPTTKKLATPSRKGTQALSKKSLETPSAKTPAATQGASTLML
ncbi:hypothetical protein HY251_22415, partial [bacterium]|nr:hypothetical protein [bacterium]